LLLHTLLHHLLHALLHGLRIEVSSHASLGAGAHASLATSLALLGALLRHGQARHNHSDKTGNNSNTDRFSYHVHSPISTGVFRIAFAMPRG
jgi:hypothetical protein